VVEAGQVERRRAAGGEAGRVGSSHHVAEVRAWPRDVREEPLVRRLTLRFFRTMILLAGLPPFG
jgi:hypothetical protein